MLLLQLMIELDAQSSHQIFDHLTTEDGLSSNKADYVLQDKEGFYWISTQNGLNRFDGTSCKVFRNDPQDSSSLTHNSCNVLIEDHQGDIWIGTYAGISRFKKEIEAFQQIFLNHPKQIFDIANRISGLTIDRDGNIWISSFGLWRYDIRNDSLTLFLHDQHNQASILEDTYVSRLNYDNVNNGIWFASSSGIQFFSISKNEFYHRHHNPLQWKVFDTAYGGEMTIDNQNNIWFQDKDNRELLRFNSQTNSITPSGKYISYGLRRMISDDQNRLWICYWLAPTEIYDPATGATISDFFKSEHPRSILSDKVTYIYADQQKNYWISSASGISIYTPQNQYYKLFQINVDKKGYENDNFNIRGIAQTDSQSLWLATNIGLYNFDFNSSVYTHIPTSPHLDRITSITSDGDKLWIGHLDKVHLFDTKSKMIIRSFKIAHNVFFIKKGLGNNVWAGIWRGGIYRIDPFRNDVQHFVADSNNTSSIITNSTISAYADNHFLWLGYNLGKGFSRYDITNNTFAHFNPAEMFPGQASAGIITAIEKDLSGSFWLGTHGGGLFKWDPVKNSYNCYLQPDGLNSNFINSIVTDKHGNTWISTSDGLNFYDFKKQIIRAPDISFVLPSGDHIANGLMGVDGYIYFFKPTEIIQINPAAYNPDTKFPRLLISNFKIFDTDYIIDRTESLKLDYDQNFFSFQFSAIRTNPKKPVNYAYLLEGFDKEWHYSTTGIASYTNVPGGKYTFQVKATNEQGEWSKPLLRMSVVVRPPFWKTWWFILLIAAALLFALYMLHLYRLTQVKKILSVRTKISQDLHDDIGGSLSSIYIYSSVAEKEVMENPVKAKEFLKQINTNSLQVMDNISDIVWANNKEGLNTSTLEGRIKNYGYELLAQKNIECDYAIDPHIEARLTSPEARKNILLIIKEALNNMAKYSNASKAKIAITQYRSTLLLVVEDNGPGFVMESRKIGNGISTMQQRSIALGGQCTIRSQPGEGTKITCMIPLAKISD